MLRWKKSRSLCHWSPFISDFSLYPLFPAPVTDFPQGAAGPAVADHQKQQLDPNTSIKTEYMSFPPPLQRSPLNKTTEQGYVFGFLHHLYHIFNAVRFFQQYSFPFLDQVYGSTPVQTTTSSLTQTHKRHSPALQLLLTVTQEVKNLIRHHRRALAACLTLWIPPP